MYKCSNEQCPYNLESYDQDETRHRNKEPHWDGLCLNCWDDDKKDRELYELEHLFNRGE